MVTFNLPYSNEEPLFNALDYLKNKLNYDIFYKDPNSNKEIIIRSRPRLLTLKLNYFDQYIEFKTSISYTYPTNLIIPIVLGLIFFMMSFIYGLIGLAGSIAIIFVVLLIANILVLGSLEREVVKILKDSLNTYKN